MNYKNIVSDAWKLAQEHSYLQWFAILPMMGAIIIDGLYIPLRYGRYFISDFWGVVNDFIITLQTSYNPLFIISIIAIIFAIIFHFLLSAFFEGGLIALINKIIQSDHKRVRSSLGFGYAMSVYLRLLKLHALTGIINPVLIYIGMSLLFEYQRYLFHLILWPMLVIEFIAIFFRLGTIYSDYDLVLKNSQIIGSIKNSFSIVIFNLKETLFIASIVLLIIVRAIINLLLVFIVPLGLIWFTTSVLNITSNTIVISIMVFIILFLYYYIVKFTSLFWVFTTAIWVYTFRALSQSTQKDLEAISG